MQDETGLGEKRFYKIGEASALTKLPAYVLRFWESEFSFLRPRKSPGQHRVYDKQAIETVLEIKRMLYEEGYTIAGVKRSWHRRRRASNKPALLHERVERIRGELQNILRILDSYGSPKSNVKRRS